jgi:hypothetical protein
VADISKNLGMENSGLLKKDVDVLGQKLDNVKNTLTQLTDLAENVGVKKLPKQEQEDVLRGIKEVRKTPYGAFPLTRYLPIGMICFRLNKCRVSGNAPL